jgi:NADPH:quinone reductase-like Zn-dependent oxidoreductase
MELVTEDLPAPGPGEARVRILAADIGASDVNVRRGRYPGAPKPPFTPGYAMVGLVDEVGPDVSEVAVGQSVGAVTLVGGYSQYIIVPVRDLTSVPAEVDPAQAVVLLFNYVAAYQMLHRVAHVQANQRILVHGAAGGIGSAFLELGRGAGASVFGTASAPKHDLVRHLGATPIDYRSEDFVERIAMLTGGAGIDAAFDPMGLAHLKQSVRTVRRGGALVAYGYYEAANRGKSPVLDVGLQYLSMFRWSLPPRRIRTAFYDLRPTMRKHPDWFRTDLLRLLSMLQDRSLTPVIAARIPLEGIVSAHERLERGEVQGRLVLIP